MKNIITLDFETYYSKTYSLSKMTTQEYILDPQFETIGVGVIVNGEHRWYTGPHAQIQKFLNQFDWANSALLCQNTMFDAAILAWHYGIYPMILLDTLAMSRALYPHQKSHSLAKQAERHGIGEKGTEVLNALGKRRADFEPDELAKYGEYCLNDCDLTLALAKLYLPRFKKSELKLIDSTLRMYTEPVFVLDEDKLRLHAQALKVTEGLALTRVMGILNLDTSVTESDIKKLLASNQKFAGVLEAFGVEPPMKLSPTTGKMAYAFAKTDEEFTALEGHDDEQVQALEASGGDPANW